jgi:O-succinylbenzoic acid--CoA ligase
MPSFNTVHECFKYNGTHYSFNTLKTLAQLVIKNNESYTKDIGAFLLEWLNDSKTIDLKTSGSTGTPKIIKIKKQAMVNSAIATGLYFNLKPGNSALLCLPAHYIAGKMMLVRALVLGLEIDSITPKSNLDINLEKHYHFAAMVPLQLEKNLSNLKLIEKLIVGGAKVSSALNAKLQNLDTAVFETYGMTETVSHIAVKQLNDKTNSKTFKVLPNVKVALDDRSCLIIEAPLVSEAKIITNDIVKMHSSSEFEWLGRMDNVINSGGIKVFPEQVENSLSGKINNRFFIASEADKTLGSRVILIIEGVNVKFNTSVFNHLNTYSKPKAVYYVDEFVLTDSGKIKRTETLNKLKKE